MHSNKNGNTLEKQEHLYQTSTASVLFNALIAGLLSVYLWYLNVPIHLISNWFLGMALISISRFVFLKKKHYLMNTMGRLFYFYTFIALTFLTGVLWGGSYFLFAPHISISNLLLIIFIFGGMSAGSVTSLGASMTAYLAYILPMFLPMMIYKASTLQFDFIIMDTMLVFYLAMIIITAKISNKLIQANINLSKSKDMLINELEKFNCQLKRAYNKIEKLSHIDQLTGLYNRRSFDVNLQKEWQRAQRHQTELALMMIDIDNFKAVNDNFGHPYGDMILKSAAKIFKKTARRSSDFIARIGGDEFAIILPDLSAQEVKHLANKIHHVANNNKKHQPIIPMSIGISATKPNEYLKLQQLIKNADKALYHAKAHGKNSVSFYSGYTIQKM